MFHGFVKAICLLRENIYTVIQEWLATVLQNSDKRKEETIFVVLELRTGGVSEVEKKDGLRSPFIDPIVMYSGQSFVNHPVHRVSTLSVGSIPHCNTRLQTTAPVFPL